MAIQQRDKSWLPYAGFVIAVAGIVYQSGVLSNKVEELGTRMTKIEAVNTSNKDALDRINIRGAQNETKLDFLVMSEKDGKK